MSDECPTMKIKMDNEEGFAICNVSDFNPDVHVAWVDPADEAAKAAEEQRAADEAAKASKAKK